ncbi:MAG TPA: hypothetical protein VFV13_13725 [Acidimicrobiia bacterium]|nr:hypothetical protein [Acidimicrobiia bacterium]
MNQPSPARLLKDWKRDLADGGDGVDLDVYGVTSSMVYWADVMYAAATDAGGGSQESIEYEGIESGALTEVDESYIAEATGNERDFIESMIANYDLDHPDEPAAEVAAEAAPDVAAEPLAATAPEARVAAASALEAVPLPWFVKRPLMRLLLRDVHHYLFNTSHSPRSGSSYKVRDEVRKRFVDDLGKVDGGPHVVVAHSLGSVIAYDCLKRVAATKKVDMLVTLGTPLGMSEIQHNMRPEWSKDDGYPGDLPRWVNVVDRLDPVCVADPIIANDYMRRKASVVVDQVVSNGGVMRHPSGKYFRQPVVQDAVREGLGL